VSRDCRDDGEDGGGRDGDGGVAGDDDTDGKRTPSPEGTRARVLLLLEGRDCDLVASELRGDYEVVVPDAGLSDAFDVAVVDERALDALGAALVDRADAAETFLPVLCLLPAGADPPPTLWERVDDVATRPVSRHELRSRIDSLLAARRRSVELRRRGDRLEQVGSVLAHDLRNPLAVAEGYVDHAVGTGDVDALGPAVDALGRIDRLIDDVLALARSGAASLDVERVDLAATARAAWSSVETGDARLVLPDGPLPVEADGGRLRELLENLFRNSVEHGSTSSRPEADDSVEHGSTGSRTESADAVEYGDATLTVTVGPLDGGDGFYVEDDGPGIPAGERERVFERGFTTGGGTGLGLAIVDRVAAAHGWTVAATEGSRGGARFEVAGCEVEDGPVG